MPTGEDNRRVKLNNGVGRKHKSDKQKELEKKQRKINRRLRHGKGVQTGGFRFGRKAVDQGQDKTSVKKSAQMSTNTVVAKNDAAVQGAINKMKPSTRRVVVNQTPATLGNANVVTIKKKEK